MRISARWFDEIGAFRGEIGFRGGIRFTLAKFDSHEEAELYTLRAILKMRMIFG